MSQEEVELVLVILNWNGWEDTLECLESLEKAVLPTYHIIIVDNNSSDNSISQIKQWIAEKCGSKPNILLNSSFELKHFVLDTSSKVHLATAEHLTLIKNNRNSGFAEGNNIAIRYALKTFNPKYFLLINNDIIVDKNFAEELIKTSEIDNKIGIVGAVNYYYADRKRINASGGTINWFNGKKNDKTENVLNTKQFCGVREVDYVPGSCFFVRSDVWRKVGLFDKEFFFYYEETDLCVRAKQKGFRIIANMDAKVWHKVSASAGRTSNFTVFYLVRNWFLFMRKNASTLQYYSFLASFFTYDFMKISAAILLWRRDPKKYLIFLKAIEVGLKHKH